MPEDNTLSHPVLIQGGMGAGVSNWLLARSVSLCGQLGVVSGTALDVILARRLQQGDPGGEMRRALAHFPFQRISRQVLDRYFVPGGKPAGHPFKPVPPPTVNPGSASVELLVLANFVEVHLAKEGHSGLVGINYLEKIQLPTLPSLFGAMLAGVDYVLMGAGIPMAIPGILDQLSRGESVQLRIDVEDAMPGEEFWTRFDPAGLCEGSAPILKRPQFLAIISSHVLAQALARKASGRVDGFVVEGPTAGGHNAPPRGASERNERGEPIYTNRDNPDLEKIRALGLPFWLAGSYASASRLAEARSRGAAGIQVGTAFAFCRESGVDAELKSTVLGLARRGEVDIYTDPVASPTGFPFKVVHVPGSVSEASVYEARRRVCDLGYLRRTYRKPDGTAGYRCPGEPESGFLSKGGRATEMQGRKCVCNGLLSTIGLGQIQSGGDPEPALLTAGDDLKQLGRFFQPDHQSYSAAQVVEQLLAPAAA